jgi:hypothetical protein
VEDEGNVKGMDVVWGIEEEVTCDERREQRGTGGIFNLQACSLPKRQHEVAGGIPMGSCSCPNLTVALVSGYSYASTPSEPITYQDGMARIVCLAAAVPGKTRIIWRCQLEQLEDT